MPFGCTPTADSPRKPDVVRKKIVAQGGAVEKAAPSAPIQKGEAVKPPAAGDQAGRQKDEEIEEKPTAAPSPSEDLIALEDRFPELYNPEGRIDPFATPFKSKEEREQGRLIARKRIPRTPLENLDISQMKLTAIIQAPEGNIGLIEEATGKGYVVSTGTYIGTHGGKIKKILSDRLIIEEEDEDVFGKTTVREVEMKLLKPAGEL